MFDWTKSALLRSVCILAISMCGSVTVSATSPSQGRGTTRSGPARPTREDVELAEGVLRREAGLSTLGGTGSAVGGETIEIEFEVIEPYLRSRLLEAIRRGGFTYAVHGELVATPATAIGVRYFEEAAASSDPLLRSIGLGKLIRWEGGESGRYLRQALSDPHEAVRCEAIAALVALQGGKAASQLKPLSKWHTTLEKCEAAAALVRLGDVAAGKDLRLALSGLRRQFPGSAKWDYDSWLARRRAYYELVLDSLTASESQNGPKGDELAGHLETFGSIMSTMEGPSAYLQSLLSRCLSHQDVDVRAQAVRLLGKLADPWATELLKTRLADGAICSLNTDGYGWDASVACLSAICLLERGDSAGVPVLQEWVAKHRVLIERGKIYPPEEADSWDANQWAGLRDEAPAIALARAGDRSVADVVQFILGNYMTEGPVSEFEAGPGWVAYHLARLGDQEGLSALRRVLRSPGGSWYHKFRLEAAGCVLALAREQGRPLLHAPARNTGGPVFYPDCWCKSRAD